MIQQIDAPLRDDVRLLGNLLGETLKLARRTRFV